MTVKTGRSGQLFVNGIRAARVTGWSLDESRPMLDNTPVNVWDQTVMPGRRSGTGSAKVVYDPEDVGSAAFFDSILLDIKGELGITLILDSLTGDSYPKLVHVTNTSHAVARGEAQMRDISFKLSDTSIALEIIGSNQAGEGATNFYTGAVYGLDGAWTFLWTISGPTISDPTSQSTSVTFPDVGTFVLTVTATLGTAVLTDSVTIIVVPVPLMWISRSTTPLKTQGFGYGASYMDTVEQTVFWGGLSYPDVSLGGSRVLIHKRSYAGAVLATKQLGGDIFQWAGEAAEQPAWMHRLADGTLVIFTDTFQSASRWLRLSADLSTILYQFRSTTTRLSTSTYDPATNRIFVNRTTRNTPYVGFIDGATGVMTRVNITGDAAMPVATSNTNDCAPLLTQSGKVLFAFMDTTRLVLCEYEKDLQNGGSYNAIRAVEHVWGVPVFGTNPASNALLETENHIVFINSGVNQLRVFLFNKIDYSYVSNARFGTEGSGTAVGQQIVSAFYSGGVITVVADRFSSLQGIITWRFSADLSTIVSCTQSGGSSVSGPALVQNVGLEPAAVWGNYADNAGFDPGLGLVAWKGRTDKFSDVACFFRLEYPALNVVQYDTVPSNRWLGASPLSTVGATEGPLDAPTNTFNRSYTGVLSAVTLTASAVTISDETEIVHQTYVLST